MESLAEVAIQGGQPERALALDAEMRAEIGAPDEVQLVVLRGDSADAVLQREEAARPQFETLVRYWMITLSTPSSTRSRVKCSCGKRCSACCQ